MDFAERFVRRRAGRHNGGDPFEKQWVSTSAGSVCLRHAATHLDRPHVLVHGIGVSGLYMLPTAARLARNSSVYIPDLPGHGDSSKPRRALDLDGLADILAELVDKADLVRPTFVGNSYGCQIVARCARRHPGICDRLVLQAPTIERAHRTASAQIGRFLWNAMWEPISEGIVVLRDYAKAGTSLIFSELRDALDNPIEDDLAALRLPVLLVRGTRDPLASRDWLELLARQSIDARIAEVAGVAHTVNFAAPARFAELLNEFDNSAEEGQPGRGLVDTARSRRRTLVRSAL